MEKTLKELAELVGGEVAGNGDIPIKGVAPLESACEGDLTFITSSKYIEHLKTTAASAIIVQPELQLDGKNLIISNNPQLAYAKILALFIPKPRIPIGADERACIGKNLKMGKDAAIFPFSYIGDDVEIGDGSVIYPGAYIGNECRVGEGVVICPNATVMDRCIIGDRVIIHSGTVIGSDGFGYARDGKMHYKIPQVGIVQIDEDVEIGANAAIDRASFGKTWIKRRAKIDNLVHVAHNVVIGEDSIITGQVGIAGSSTVGSNVIFGGQAGVSDHVNIGDNVMVAARAGVFSDIESNQVVSGFPAMPHKEWLKASAVFPKLPEMKKAINELEKRVAELEALLKQKS